MIMRFKFLFPAIVSAAFLASCSSQRIVAGGQDINNPATTASASSAPVSQSQAPEVNSPFEQGGGSGETVVAPAGAVK